MVTLRLSCQFPHSNSKVVGLGSARRSSGISPVQPNSRPRKTSVRAGTAPPRGRVFVPASPVAVPRGLVRPRGASAPTPGPVDLPLPVGSRVWGCAHSGVGTAHSRTKVAPYIFALARPCRLPSFPTGTSTACFWRPAFPLSPGAPSWGFTASTGSTVPCSGFAKARSAWGFLGASAGGRCPPGTHDHPACKQ